MGVAADCRRTRLVKTAPMPLDRMAIMKRDPENRFTLPDDGHEADPKSTLCSTGLTKDLALLLVAAWVSWTGALRAAEVTEGNRIPVTDGVVTPCRPVNEAIARAMQFLKKADSGYVPGRIDGEPADYFTHAHVNEDGSSSNRQPAFPARPHVCFIFTFLRHHACTADRQWPTRKISGSDN